MVKRVAGGLLVVLSMSGCAAMREREWGTCAIAGGIIGAAVGGVTGGVTANNNDSSDAVRGGAIGGGIVGGGAIGTLLGHLICDPVKAAPAPPPPAPPPPATKIEELKGANFDFNKATLKPEGRRHVEHAAEIMKKNPSMNVSVEGHTDSIGSDKYNMKLSERRAQSVADALVQDGIAKSRITTRGFGKSRPIADNKTEAGRAENRRAEIIAR